MEPLRPVGHDQWGQTGRGRCFGHIVPGDKVLEVYDEVVAAALLQLLHTRSQAAEFCFQVGINQPRQGQRRLSKEEVEEHHYQASI